MIKHCGRSNGAEVGTKCLDIKMSVVWLSASHALDLGSASNASSIDVHFTRWLETLHHIRLSFQWVQSAKLLKF